MKRGKEEEKRLEPMFPRLHVKDAEKGGPRAPPRNKMALYEQLSIPSQRFTSSDRVGGSLPRNTSPLLPPGPSSNQGTDNFVTQMPLMENVRTSPAQHDHQRKIAREEDDFAVPVFINSRRPGRGKSGLKRGVGLAANSATEDMDLASTSDRVDDGRINNGVESHMEASEEEGHGNLNDEYCTSGGGGYTSLQQQINNEEEASDDNSMVDSVSSLDVSPDEVVGVLGQKRFWRARKAIAKEGHSYIVQGACRDSLWILYCVFLASACWNMSPVSVCQQRVFAVQLFELHRLIKVQRLIAASPDVLVDDMSYVGKVAAKSYPVKKLHLPSGFLVKPPLPQVIKHRSSDYSEKTDQHKMECSAENVVGRLPNQGQGQGHHHQQPSNYMMPFATNQPNANGCYYPPQPPTPSGGNQQWLIPVMSPSEGLIYKPHPGPGPGHTGPVCGGYYGHFMPAPMFMGGGDQPPPFHPGMGFPSHGNGYFPPYGGIMMNPYYSGQQQQQQPNEQMNNNIQQQSSVNEATSQQQQQPTKSYPRAKKSRQEGISGKKKSFQPFSAVDDDDDNDKINNAAPPTEEMMTTTTTTTTTVTQTTRDGAGVTRVIKVVPHNANLASENAARIFRSIQEERKQYYP
ncbi:hypothetical protein IGI04_038120 [Brassica rapa subsp. trilocularis]|uniref:EARLY FLOWERING 3 n=1 Tax=Brassica rapa subsp. trilocularis TaxID=1813537 RepID=A0ABQ7LLZ9_BRACM|nr:hypothetical protein IGI04_038120 [Brassica rapa subsp. trilocularis]